MGELVKVVSRLYTHKHIKHIFRFKGAMSCYLLYFQKSLLSLATDGKDGHGLKFEKVGPTFSSFSGKLPARLLPACSCCSLMKFV